MRPSIEKETPSALTSRPSVSVPNSERSGETHRMIRASALLVAALAVALPKRQLGEGPVPPSKPLPRTTKTSPPAAKPLLGEIEETRGIVYRNVAPPLKYCPSRETSTGASCERSAAPASKWRSSKAHEGVLAAAHSAPQTKRQPAAGCQRGSCRASTTVSPSMATLRMPASLQVACTRRKPSRHAELRLASDALYSSDSF